MAEKELIDIFKKGSRTYFYSSLFFPQHTRDEVSARYAFVRTADDLVDRVKPDVDGFRSFKSSYLSALKEGRIGDRVIDSFVSLLSRRGIERGWVASFLSSMEMDLEGRAYRRMGELRQYIYGSAEVVGLMMARVLRLPEESYRPARALGRAMQYINMIRDIQEDTCLGRCYFPREDLEASGLADLQEPDTAAGIRSFGSFLREQIGRYRIWMAEAHPGYRHIRKRYLVPIKTAADMYDWTARTIYEDPMVVFRRQVKPSSARVMLQAGANTLSLWSGGTVP